MKKRGGGCLGAPMRALSRACDSACNLYVRGMSGCARSVPSAAGAVGRGFGGSGAASSLRLRVSSDSADDLVRAASARRQQRRVAAEPGGVDGAAAAAKKGVDGAAAKKCAAARQRRVAAEPPPAEVVGCGAGKKGGFASSLITTATTPAVKAPARKKACAADMGTIAEDAPCEFGTDGACAAAPSLKPPRRGGLGAARAGSGVFAR